MAVDEDDEVVVELYEFSGCAFAVVKREEAFEIRERAFEIAELAVKNRTVGEKL